MVVGDVVSGFSAPATILNFQPAAGVEIMISAIAMNNNVNLPKLNDGANTTYLAWGTNEEPSGSNIKVFINNSIYLYIPALPAGEVSGFTGIQIK